MYNFHVIEGRKLINYKAGKEQLSRAIERLPQIHPEIEMVNSFKELKKEYPETFKKYLYLALKFIQKSFDFKRKYDEEYIAYFFNLITAVDCMVGLLAPYEFMTMFPVTKKYDGEVYEEKDYFYTMGKIRSMDMYKPIGEERSCDFLLDYCNKDINMYMVAWMGIVSRRNMQEGGKDILLEFFEENGTPLHTLHQEGDCIVDGETGERYKAAKQDNRLRKIFTVL